MKTATQEKPKQTKEQRKTAILRQELKAEMPLVEDYIIMLWSWDNGPRFQGKRVALEAECGDSAWPGGAAIARARYRINDETRNGHAPMPVRWR